MMIQLTMRILHLATSLDGGAGIAARRIAEAQSENGMDVELWSRHSKKVELEKFEKLIQLNVSKKIQSKLTTYLQSRLLQNSKFLVTPFSTNALRLRDFEQNTFDIIHLHASYNFTNVMDLGKWFSNTPLVVTLHDQRMFTGGCHYSEECEGFKSNCRNCPQVRKTFNWIPAIALKQQIAMRQIQDRTRFVSPSSWLAETAKTSQALRGSEISVIRNPVPSFFENRPEKKNLDKTLQIGFISENLNNPYKGLRILLEALSQIPKEMQVHLRLIGSGSVSFELPNVRTTHNKCANSSEVAKELVKCDVVIVPSTQDNSPSVISESLMCGVPVIGSSVGGIAEILHEFRLPMFESGNSGQLAELIQKFPEFSSDAIAQKARTYFSYERSATEYQTIYKSSLS
jgi:glycosyltransferase involved in cell wall biosynthesis